ncbi:hypothetical protein J4E83_008792 [Alternaria metachromatica]|uniref:uncharacterized protein n=1 Tax=Alternaria metachromatica TaxID=283354 RepID=UPI0020C3E476|nr:uncharacterized protein J4E83_008792 [Alternaria metachromatica]KAI4609151.1 hypothetical protein J4E83_008792 [Alternaria metachromatica]
MCARLPSLWDVPVSFQNDASNVMFDPLLASEDPFNAAQSGFPLTDLKRESLTEPAHDQVISAPKDEKKKRKLGPEVAETELKRRIERADTYWVLDVTTEDIQRTVSGAKRGLNVAKYVKDFIGLTSAWMLGDVYTREYRKLPTLIPRVVKTVDLINMSLATPIITKNDIDEKMMNFRTYCFVPV